MLAGGDVTTLFGAATLQPHAPIIMVILLVVVFLATTSTTSTAVQ